jgi:predicted DNA binding CopG/RHH family protein
MSSTQKTKPSKFPGHWSEARDEEEEARWWEAHGERLILEAAQRGTLRIGPIEDLLKEMKAKVKAAKPTSIRLLPSDIERAKEQAKKVGMPYQTYLKSLLHRVLEEASAETISAGSARAAKEGKEVSRGNLAPGFRRGFRVPAAPTGKKKAG